MKEYVQKRLQELVADIREVDKDLDPDAYDDDRDVGFTAVSGRIWESGDTSDICHAAHSGGQIEALRLICQEQNLQLDPEFEALFEWAEVINPS